MFFLEYLETQPFSVYFRPVCFIYPDSVTHLAVKGSYFGLTSHHQSKLAEETISNSKAS